MAAQSCYRLNSNDPFVYVSEDTALSRLKEEGSTPMGCKDDLIKQLSKVQY